jgi:membrane peptidoglycan carboxypeptidase
MTLREALDNSINLAAVKLEYYITRPRNVAQTAAAFGMTSLYKDNPHLDCRVCWAVTLGGLTRGTRLLEETAAYGVFASSGWTVPPVPIWKIVRRSTRQVLFCSSSCPRGVKPSPLLAPSRKHVLDAGHAYEMTNVLSDNSARCTLQVCEFGLNSPLLLSRPAAAKTGTTNSFTDNWTVGYTPQIVTGAWVGNDDHTPMQDVTGIIGAAPIWHAYMENAFKILRLPVQQFVRPPNVTMSSTCTVPGSRTTSYGTTDIQVQPEASPPLCYLPDRGFNPSGCGTASSYTYMYGYGYVTPVTCPSTAYTQPYGYLQPYTSQQPVQPQPAVPAPPAAGVPPVAPTAAPLVQATPQSQTSGPITGGLTILPPATSTPP